MISSFKSQPTTHVSDAFHFTESLLNNLAMFSVTRGHDCGTCPPAQDGAKGHRGEAGQNGQPGFQGFHGARGPAGEKGGSGKPGPDGVPGSEVSPTGMSWSICL